MLFAFFTSFEIATKKKVKPKSIT